MSIIKEVLRRDIVEPLLSKRVHSVAGYIVDYNKQSNRATVNIHDPLGVKSHGRQITVLHDVICSTNPGYKAVSPMPGNRVLVTFEGGDITQPKIVMFFDEDYGRDGGPANTMISTHGQALTHKTNITGW